MPRSLLYFHIKPLILFFKVYMHTNKQDREGAMLGRRHQSTNSGLRSGNDHYTCAGNQLSGPHCVKN